MWRSAAAHLLEGGRRWLSSLPASAVREQALPEAVTWTGGAPIVKFLSTALIKLPERPWGPAAVLPGALVHSTAGAGKERIGVVREAFTPQDTAQQPLAMHLAVLPDGTVAVSHAASDPAKRLIVDEYTLAPNGEYRLDAVGTDLLRLLRREQRRVVHVPDVAAAELAALNSVRAARRGARQSTNEVLMVAPTAFGFNEQAAQDNTFMHASASTAPTESVTARVLREFAGLHTALTEHAGVRVTLFEHAAHHDTPDACFPNNWFSTHAAGEGGCPEYMSTLALYPMKWPNRQAERRKDITEVLQARGYGRMLDLTGHEAEGRAFEGTGALVLDRINGVAYVALSERADPKLASAWAERLGYNELVVFHSTDAQGAAVYHTNVMMAIGTDVAVVCLESVPDDGERAHLRERLSRHHTVVDISRGQMGAMCGNVLEVADGRGLPVLAMSSQAHNAFTPDQRALLRRHVAALVHAPIPTLEHIGGGGVRCALAELF